MGKKLYRDGNDKVLGGVCSGLANYFEMDPTLVRIAFVLIALFGGSGVLLYIICWIVIPQSPNIPIHHPYGTDYRVYEDDRRSENPKPFIKNRSSNAGIIIGLLLIAFGFYFLLDEFDILPYWFDFQKLWPLFIIVPGILMITKSGKKQKTENTFSSEKLNEQSKEISPDSMTDSQDQPLT